MGSGIVAPEKITKTQVTNMMQHSDVDRILSLRSCGWGAKKISRELGISRRIVKKYIRLGKWQPASKRSSRKLDGLDVWLEAAYKQHHGNADVVRQQLAIEHNIHVSLRTVERAVQKWRQEAFIDARATIRFETPPGKQLQIDFGSINVQIGGTQTRVYLFIATLGYSRRLYVAAFSHDRQNVWFKGIEGAFIHFGGIPEQLLLDNAKALVLSHNPVSREVLFNDRFKAFAQYWGFRATACAPYRARTKGKDERMVGYVKKNAIAGRTFCHWEALTQHLERWNAEVADKRIHGTVKENPLERFLRDEASALRPLPGLPSFIQVRELSRRVHADACIEVDTNHYSVPCSLVGKLVSVQVTDHMVTVIHNGLEVAVHFVVDGRRQRILVREHLQGIVSAIKPTKALPLSTETVDPKLCLGLLRPLAEYEALVGGRW